MVDAIVQGGLPLCLHGGGLWRSPTKLGPEKGAYIRDNDGRIAALTGQSLGGGYMAEVLSDPETIFWSQPIIAAVLAAGAVKHGADLAMLHAIQVANYVEGRRVVESGTLTDLAVSIGLDRAAFDSASDAGRAAEHIESSRAMMSGLGLHGLPNFVLETQGERIRIPHAGFSGRSADFVEAVTRTACRHAAWDSGRSIPWSRRSDSRSRPECPCPVPRCRKSR